MELKAIVQNRQMSESEYRGLKDRLSYSSIKDFDTDREKFFREFVMGEARKESSSNALILGSLVHCLLANQHIEDKFYELKPIKAKGQMKDLAEALFKQSFRKLEDGARTEPFLTLFTDAVNSVKLDSAGNEIAFKNKNIETILGMFEKSVAEEYYNDLMSSKGKMPVTETQVKKAEVLVGRLREHSFTYMYANAMTDKTTTVYNELPILFEVKGVAYKSMVDRIIVDHEQKLISPIDWKTSWDNEEPQRAYLKFGYYLQAGLYHFAIKKWAEENNMGDYTVEPMKYIFCDTSGFSDPVVLVLSKDDISKAWTGFTIRGYRYRGLAELMEDIAWHNDNAIWTTSKEIHDKKGHIKLSIEYGASA
jgi:hypothetical protein